MSTKTIILSLALVIFVGSVVYFSIRKEHLSIEATTLPPLQTTKGESENEEGYLAKEPTATSSKELKTSLNLQTTDTSTSTKPSKP